MQKLAPMVKDMEHLAAKFSDDPDQVLPEAESIESGRTSFPRVYMEQQELKEMSGDSRLFTLDRWWSFAI